MIADYWDYYLYGYDAPGSGMGMATTLPTEPERDIGAELRTAVEDVTGKPVAPPDKPRIGFV
jgi:hypothetical protein